MAYTDGFLVPVPVANREPYRKLSAEFAPVFKELGALRHVEAWGEDVPEGKVTDMRRAVIAKDDETVVFSFIEYPDRATRDAAGQAMMDHPKMKEMDAGAMPMDGKRMIYSGFEGIFDTGQVEGGAYIDGSVAPAAPSSKAAYTAYSARVAPVFLAQGALRVVETWGDDLMVGKVNDFRTAVNADADEAIVFSWIEWPSKAVRDAAWAKLMADGSLTPKEDEVRRIDNQRRIFGGFTSILDI